MRFALAGDVMLGRLVNEALRKRAPEDLWGDTAAVLHQADWRICNLECALTDRGEPWSETPKTFHFRSDAKNAAALTAAGFDAVSLANNHVLDYGQDGLEDTIEVLNCSGILHAGAGMKREEAENAAIDAANGLRVGLVSFTDNQPEWAAGDDRPGVHYVPVDVAAPEARRLFDRVSATKAAVDVLIVAAHWGPNWGAAPPEGHPEFARALVEHGADIVFGHSAHVVRGIELYRERPILYSTGDFIDDYAVDPKERNDHGFLFMVDADVDGVHGMELHPTCIRDFSVQPAPEEEAARIVEKMKSLCADLGTEAEWDAPTGRLRIAMPVGASTQPG